MYTITPTRDLHNLELTLTDQDGYPLKVFVCDPAETDEDTAFFQILDWMRREGMDTSLVVFGDGSRTPERTNA